MTTVRPRVKPIRRVNPSGATVWVARYPTRDGARRSSGTYTRRGPCPTPSPGCCAQHAIDTAIDREWGTGPRRPDTIGAYAATWTARHPRSARTNATNEHRLNRILDARVEGVPLRNWPFADLRRRHTVELVQHLLVEQGRAAVGAQGILRVLSAMAEDAITDEVCDTNPFRGVRVRSNDPRVSKAPRRPRIWTWEQMHALAAAAGEHEAMVRMLTDCGLRLGELLALERRDLEPGLVRVRRNAHEGRVTEGSSRTKDHHRVVPVPPAAEALVRALPVRIDTPLLFPTLRGLVWRESNFRRDVWGPAQRASGVDAKPHECRHSWESRLRAAGVDGADLAMVAGHSLAVANAVYVHGLGESFEAIRRAVG